MASDLTLRGITGPRGVSTNPGSDKIIEQSDNLLAAGRDYLKIRDYDSAKACVTSALQGYQSAGELTKIQECNALLCQIITQPSISAFSLETSRRHVISREGGAPTSRVRRIAPLLSSTNNLSVDKRTQFLLKRLEGETFGDKMQFPRVYYGHRTDEGKGSK